MWSTFNLVPIMVYLLIQRTASQDELILQINSSSKMQGRIIKYKVGGMRGDSGRVQIDTLKYRGGRWGWDQLILTTLPLGKNCCPFHLGIELHLTFRRKEERNNFTNGTANIDRYTLPILSLIQHNINYMTFFNINAIKTSCNSIMYMTVNKNLDAFFT